MLSHIISNQLLDCIQVKDLQLDSKLNLIVFNAGELGYDGPLYDRLLAMTDDMLVPSPMHIKYVSYVYDGPIFLVP